MLSFATGPKTWKLTFANRDLGVRQRRKAGGTAKMNKNRKADLRGIGSNENDYFTDIQKTFSFSDYKSELEPVQQIPKRLLPGASMYAVIDCFDCKRKSEL